MQRLVLLVSTLILSACAVELPTAPPLSQRPSLTEEDQQVVVALVEQKLRPRLTSSPADAPPLVLLSDLTLRECQVVEMNQHGIECVPSWAVALYLERRPEWGTHLGERFSERNATARLLTLPQLERVRVISVRDDVRFTQSGRYPLWALLQAFPLGSDIFTVSAPVYTSFSSARVAVIYYVSPSSGGLVYLVRDGAGWTVKSANEWVE